MQVEKSVYSGQTLPSDVIVLGSFVQDLSFNTEEFPSVGETRIGTFKTGPGGKGSNQAFACARQMIRTKFISCIGKDSFGEEIIQALKNEKINYHISVSDNKPSGTASIVVNKRADNLIVVALGANEDLPICPEEEIKEGKILVCQLESNLYSTYEALKIAKKHDLMTILNPAPINPEFDTNILKYVDVLTPNESEFLHLYNMVNWKNGADDIIDADEYQELLKDDYELHAKCRKLCSGIVIVTLGKDGCFVSNWDGNYFRVPSIDVKAIDTAGAGDAFTGGLAAGLFDNPGNLERAVQYATVVAGLSTTKTGTAPSMPKRRIVTSYLNVYINKEKDDHAVH